MKSNLAILSSDQKSINFIKDFNLDKYCNLYANCSRNVEDAEKFSKKYNFSKIYDLQNSQRTYIYQKYFLRKAEWVTTKRKDHKKILEGEKGLNTGGMGAYTPVPSISSNKMNELSKTFVEPIVQHLAEQGIKYQGMFYAGLILTDKGPNLLEINVRFGDPETQAIIPLLETDLLVTIYSSITTLPSDSDLPLIPSPK